MVQDTDTDLRLRLLLEAFPICKPIEVQIEKDSSQDSGQLLLSETPPGSSLVELKKQIRARYTGLRASSSRATTSTAAETVPNSDRTNHSGSPPKHTAIKW